jgi:23S rRNA (uracil1939-C5)-methyltransferase
MARRMSAPVLSSEAARCRHFGVCGGCAWQGSALQDQHSAKRQGIQAILHEAGLPSEVHALHAVDPWRTRNRMEFSFGNRRWVLPGEPEGTDRSFALGLHPRRRFDRVFDLAECPVAFDEAETLVNAVRTLARAQGLSAWNPHDHCGLLRQLLVRKGFATGEVLLEIVSDGSNDLAVSELAARLFEQMPTLSSMTHVRHAGFADVTPPTAPRVILQGSAFIHEIVNGVRFRLQSSSFFQPSTQAAGILAELVVNAVRGSGAVSVEDWCCGTGFFSLQLAHAGVARVHGIELNPAAVEDARANALLNNLDVSFDCADIAQHALSTTTPAECIVVDPPRAGLPLSALKALTHSRAQRVVFLACDLAAGVSQVQALVASGRQLMRTELVDQFPHTPHVEAVLILDRHSDQSGS